MLTLVTTDTQLPFTEDQLQYPVLSTFITLGQAELVLVAILCQMSKIFELSQLQGGWWRVSGHD